MATISQSELNWKKLLLKYKDYLEHSNDEVEVEDDELNNLKEQTDKYYLITKDDYKIYSELNNINHHLSELDKVAYDEIKIVDNETMELNIK